MTILAALAGLGALVWQTSSAYVGARLLLLGFRNDDPPARWIGTYLFFAMGLGGLLFSIPTTRAALAGTGMTPFDRTLVALAFVTTVIGIASLLTFTPRVFRPRSSLATCAAVALSLMIVVGAVGHGISTRFDGTWRTPLGALFLAVPVFANGWAGVESLLYYRMMRRRLAVGLAEPLVTNRFLLWGVGAGSAASLLLLNWLDLQVLPHGSDRSGTGVNGISLACMAVLGLVGAGSYLFAFFPARWYVRRFAASPSET